MQTNRFFLSERVFETELLKWIGFDDRGLELEIVAVPLVDHLLVIHVMPFRFRRER